MARVRVSIQAGRCDTPAPLEYPASAKTGLADVVRRARRSAPRELVSSFSGEATGKRTHRNCSAGKESVCTPGASVSARAVLRLHVFERRGLAQGPVVAASIAGAVLSGGSPQGEVKDTHLDCFGESERSSSAQSIGPCSAARFKCSRVHASPNLNFFRSVSKPGVARKPTPSSSTCERFLEIARKLMAVTVLPKSSASSKFGGACTLRRTSSCSGT